jgi:sugar O-acyltransferase (sialic acid O-acetyltransferase NeuD family)
MKKVVIIGAGGFGRETLDVFDACNQAKPEYEVLGYIVQPQYAQPGEMVHGKPVLGDFGWLERHSKDVYAICSLGAPHHRRRLVEMAQRAGARFCSVVHPTAIINRDTTFGEGVIINAMCGISSLIRIGNHVQINGMALIGHDVVIEDFVTVSPGVMIAGKVTVEEGAFIGIGSIIIENITVGAWSAVGAGTTIVKDVPENTTTVGVAGKVIKTRPAGWQNEIDEGN